MGETYIRRHEEIVTTGILAREERESRQRVSVPWCVLLLPECYQSKALGVGGKRVAPAKEFATLPDRPVT
jgi:hypothetical protein